MTATLVKLIAPVPLTERGRAINFEVTDDCLIYSHGKSFYLKPANNGDIVELRHSHETSIIRVAPCGTKYAMGDVLGNLRIIAGTFQSHVVKFEGRVLASRIADIRWDADGQFVAVSGEGRGMYVAVINSETGQSMGELAGPTKACNSVTVCAGKIAVASDDFTVSFYAGPPFRLSKTLRDHTRFVSCVSFSPDGQLFISGGADGKLFVYNGNDASLKFELTETQKLASTITAAVWSKDSLLLYTSSLDGIVRKWNLDAKTCQEYSLGQQILGLGLQGATLVALLLDGSFITISPELIMMGAHVVLKSLHYHNLNCRVIQSRFRM
jgi:WD40 repeat protein